MTLLIENNDLIEYIKKELGKDFNVAALQFNNKKLQLELLDISNKYYDYEVSDTINLSPFDFLTVFKTIDTFIELGKVKFDNVRKSLW